MIASKQQLKLSALNFVNFNDKSTDVLPVRLGSNLHIAIEPTVEGMQESKKRFFITVIPFSFLTEIRMRVRNS